MPQRGVIHIPAVIFLVGIAVFAVTLFTSLKEPNQIVNQTTSQVLGDDAGSGSSGSGSSGSGGSSGDRSSDSDNEDDDNKSDSSGSSDSKTRTITPAGTKIETKTSPQRVKTEIRFSEDEKIKTRVEEDRTRIDIYSGGVKVRYEVRDGRVVIKAETKEGEGVPEQELFKIDDRLDKAGIKVATEGGKLLITRNNVGAFSNFPLQIDLNTNQLIASTSAGVRVLTILPDQAVQNMLAANVISRLGPPFIRQVVESGEATSAAQIVELGLREGIPVYEIPGIRDFNLLGFIPISRPVTAVVSADSGELVVVQQSLLTQIIDILSP